LAGAVVSAMDTFVPFATPLIQRVVYRSIAAKDNEVATWG